MTSSNSCHHIVPWGSFTSEFILHVLFLVYLACFFLDSLSLDMLKVKNLQAVFILLGFVRYCVSCISLQVLGLEHGNLLLSLFQDFNIYPIFLHLYSKNFLFSEQYQFMFFFICMFVKA